MPIFKKKLKDTAVGKFLKEKAPHIIEAVGKRFPTVGLITDIIQKDDKLTPEEKTMALEMAKLELQHEHEITERWRIDAGSDSWLSKNTRPIVLLSAMLMFFVFITLDSLNIEFEIKDIWIDTFAMVLETSLGGYFLVRSVEKIFTKKR